MALKSENDGAGTSLALRARAGTKEKILSFKTLPEKCAFSRLDQKIIYCAIPRSLTGALPDDWWHGRVAFEDTLWKIDLDSGETKSLLEGGGFDMAHLLLSPSENYIFFINKRDSLLWSLKII